MQRLHGVALQPPEARGLTAIMCTATDMYTAPVPGGELTAPGGMSRGSN